MKSKCKIYFRADGNAQMGLGHVIRSLALAEMLQEDFDCNFIIRNLLPALKQQILEVCQSITELPDTKQDVEEAQYIAEKYLTGNEIVVLDGYHFRTAYQCIIKNTGCKLVCIDDIHAYHFGADVVINHAPGLSESAYSVEPYAKLCLGLDYSLLRKPFLEAAKKKRDIDQINNIFICFGGADFNNVTLKVLKKLNEVKAFKINVINIVLGSANKFKPEIEEYVNNSFHASFKIHYNLSAKEMCCLMESCQLAFVPASSILYEVIATKMVVVSGYYIDNQINVYNGFNDLGIIYGVGDYNKFENVKELFLNLSYDSIKRTIELQTENLSGISASNLLGLFKKLQKNDGDNLPES